MCIRDSGLPFGQDELIEALLGVNKNLVLVLLSGNAVEMPWVSRVPAIVQAGNPLSVEFSPYCFSPAGIGNGEVKTVLVQVVPKTTGNDMT